MSHTIAPPSIHPFSCSQTIAQLRTLAYAHTITTSTYPRPPQIKSQLQLVIPVAFRPRLHQYLLVIKHCALWKYPKCYKPLPTNTHRPQFHWHSAAPSSLFLAFRGPQVAQLAVMCSNCWQCCLGKDT